MAEQPDLRLIAGVAAAVIPPEAVAAELDVIEQLDVQGKSLDEMTTADRTSTRAEMKRTILGIRQQADRITALAAADAARADAALRSIGIVHGLAKLTKGLMKEVHARRADAQAAADGLERVHACVPSLGAPEMCVVPGGYELTLKGLEGFSYDADGNLQPHTIARNPVAPVGRIQACDSTELVIAVFNPQTGLRYVTLDSAAALDGRKLHSPLANANAGITTKDADKLATYFADYIQVNEHRIPRAVRASSMGWQGTAGSDGFLAGYTRLQAGAPSERCDVPNTRRWADGGALYVGGLPEGANDAFASVARRGSMDAWVDAVASATDCPVPMVMLGAALTAPLLELLGIRPFCADVSGMTSTGKSTSARIAASCWGYPDTSADPIGKNPAGISTWTTTHVALETRAALRTDIPLFMDDTKSAPPRQGERLIPSALYMLDAGTGKARGTKDAGLRATRELRTVLLTTGEKPITEWSKDGGTRARVLAVTERPFPKGDRQRVESIEEAVRHHYGHAGPVLAQWLLDHRNDWPSWRERHDVVRRMLIQASSAGNVATRLSRPAAAILVALEMAEHAMGLRVDREAVFALLTRTVKQGDDQADQAAAALEALLTRVASCEDQFWTRHQDERRKQSRRPLPAPPGGWAGRWEYVGQVDADDDKTERRTELLGIRKDWLREYLEREGYDFGDVFTQWRARGWVRGGDGRSVGKRVPIAGSRVRCIVIANHAIEAH